MPNVPAKGWFATVTLPNGTTLTPSVIDGDGVSPSQNPQSNSRPSIRLPIPKDALERYRSILGDGSNDISLAAYHDGSKQPIDTLVDVDDAPGHTVLVGEGARELKTRVEASFDQKAVHNAADDLITNNTTYTANVDTPSTTTETNTALVTLSTNSDWLVRTDITDTDPVQATGGDLQQAQTAFFAEAEDADTTSGTRGTTGSEDDNYSGATGRVMEDTGDRLAFDFTPEHRIPGENVVIQARDGFGDQTTDIPALTWTLNENEVDRQLAPGTANIGMVSWRPVSDGTLDIGGGYNGGPLEAGTTYTLAVEIDDGGDAADRYPLDCVVVYDDRFNHSADGSGNSFDNTTDGNDTLDDPALFPTETVVEFDIVPAPQAVTGIRGEATLNGGDSGYTHYLSNDQGANFTSGTGANFETDSLGATWGPGITYKAGLSRFGSRTTASPNSGFNGQNLESLTLKADLEDMPLVVNRTFDGHLDSILTELAEIGDQLWEYRRDGGTERIEWTSPGQRLADRTPNVNDFQATKTVGTVYQKAIVYGQPDTPVRGERFESNHGNAVSLGNDRLQSGSERVSDPDTGARFRSGSDYTMDYQAGEITVLAGGEMADATTYTIDYNYQAFGQFDDGTASPNVTPRIDLPGLWSDFLCEQAARLIINEVSTPIHTAQVTLPNDETGWSVVESLAPDVVPTGTTTETVATDEALYGVDYGASYGGGSYTNTVPAALHVKDVENTPQATILTLGSRRSVSDVVSDIRAQIGAVSQKA